MPDSEFACYSWGLVNASVCTSLVPEEAERRLNRELPTGISSRWTLAEEDAFADNTPHPYPCEQKPATHKHYLFHC